MGCRFLADHCVSNAIWWRRDSIMKTIDLSQTQLSVDELLDSARHESVMVQAADGTSFVLSLADEFATEVELLRRNHAFLALLDSYKKAQKTISLDEVEKRLR